MDIRIKVEKENEQLISNLEMSKKEHSKLKEAYKKSIKNRTDMTEEEQSLLLDLYTALG